MDGKIYFDYNATTMMSQETKSAMMHWCNHGNPSSGYPAAKEAREMMYQFREWLGKLCGFDPCCKEERDNEHPTIQLPSQYKILFTSGASESNCTILQSVTMSYAWARNTTPHVIMSAIEHKSLYDMATKLSERGIITVDFIAPTPSGHVKPQDIERAIIANPNTCIVICMHANNETGAINDIDAIGAIAHAHGVPFHCDTVQTFGKIKINPAKSCIDSFSISFHKIGGPPGCGVLVIKQQLISGYKMLPLIFGTQNEGLRGGTENLPGIGSAFSACRQFTINRAAKNTEISIIKEYIMVEIGKYFRTRQYTNYYKSGSDSDVEVVFLSGNTKYYLRNTILLSVVKKHKPSFCNTELKDELYKRGFIVSVGSACNTSSKSASHVLYAMNADELIRKGAIRISLGDSNILSEGEKFVREFIGAVNKQLM